MENDLRSEGHSLYEEKWLRKLSVYDIAKDGRELRAYFSDENGSEKKNHSFMRNMAVEIQGITWFPKEKGFTEKGHVVSIIEVIVW
jgi:hypothetical protein